MDMRFADTIEMYRRQYIGAVNMGSTIPISPAALRAEVQNEIKVAPGVGNAPWIEPEAAVKKLAGDFDAEYTKFYNKLLELPLPQTPQLTFVQWFNTTRRAALAALAAAKKKPAATPKKK
jgi:cell division protein FtsX